MDALPDYYYMRTQKAMGHTSQKAQWKWKWSRSVMSASWQPHGLYLPGSSIHGIFQARLLKWVAISFSRASSQPRDRTHVSCVAGGFFTTESLGKPRYTMKSESESVSHSVMPNSLRPHGLQPTRLLCPWDFPGKSTGMVAISFSKESSWPWDQTQVSCTAGRLFTNWANREAPYIL